MRSFDWLRRGALGALGIVSCGGEIERQPFQGSPYTIASVTRLLRFPELSDLERKVIYEPDSEKEKKDLQEQADYGERFHSSVSLFVGNYTLGAASWFAYDFEHGEQVSLYDVDRLKNKAWSIRHNGEKNSDYTLERCAAAEGLHTILKKAGKEGHLDEAAKVIGYLSRVAAGTNAIFSSFSFHYEHSFNKERPKNILGWYKNDVAEIKTMAERAWHKWDYLSKEVRDELTMWIGRYGHEDLAGMTSQTTWFKDNQPDRETIEKVLPEMPPVPKLGKDAFYKQFGEELLRGYGVVAIRR